jgi:hypothetical protein
VSSETKLPKAEQTKQAQGYDGSPPRCATCVYFRREPHTLYLERTIKTRKGRVKTIRVRAKRHPINNPIVDRCSFGNFETKPHALCDEWRSRDGETLEPTVN